MGVDLQAVERDVAMSVCTPPRQHAQHLGEAATIDAGLDEGSCLTGLRREL